MIMRIIQVKLIGIVLFSLIFQTSAYAVIVGASWQAYLNVLPGMDNELPDGVFNGQTVSGSFTYDTSWHWFSASNDGRVCNYPIYTWNLNLGEHLFSRNYFDGLGIIGQGGLQIRNNDPVYHDYLCFGMSIDPLDLSKNVNEYFFILILEDIDSSVWNAAEPLPISLDFSKFELVNLKIWRVKIGVPGASVLIAEMNGMEVNLVEIPEPATLLLLGLGGLILRRLKFKN